MKQYTPDSEVWALLGLALAMAFVVCIIVYVMWIR